jgi:hypothetical protein
VLGEIHLVSRNCTETIRIPEAGIWYELGVSLNDDPLGAREYSEFPKTNRRMRIELRLCRVQDVMVGSKAKRVIKSRVSSRNHGSEAKRAMHDARLYEVD